MRRPFRAIRTPASAARNVTTSLPRNINFFPDTYTTSCSLQLEVTSASGTGAAFVFKGNSLDLVGPAISTGTTAYPVATTFTANAPAGLRYLLANNNVAGASAPYSQYRIKGSRIEVYAFPPSGNANDMVVFPNTNLQFTGSTSTQLMEQPNAVVRTWDNARQTVPLTPLVNYQSTQRMFGLSDPLLLEDGSYDGTASLDPQYPWYWHVVSSSFADTGAEVRAMRIRITYFVQFFDRNNFNSTVAT